MVENRWLSNAFYHGFLFVLGVGCLVIFFLIKPTEIIEDIKPPDSSSKTS